MMIMRLVIGAFFVAVFLTIWGVVYWTLLGLAGLGPQPIPNEEAVVKNLKENLPENGVFNYPRLPAITDPEVEKRAAQERFKAGPLVQITYRAEGVDPLGPDTHIHGFFHFFACALLAGLLLAAARTNLRPFFARVLFVFFLGVFAAVVADVPAQGVWSHRAWELSLLDAGYSASGWLLAGLVLAYFVRSTREV